MAVDIVEDIGMDDSSEIQVTFKFGVNYTPNLTRVRKNLVPHF